MKRLTIGLTATAIITLGVFAFSGCEKEESKVQSNYCESCSKASMYGNLDSALYIESQYFSQNYNIDLQTFSNDPNLQQIILEINEITSDICTLFSESDSIELHQHMQFIHDAQQQLAISATNGDTCAMLAAAKDVFDITLATKPKEPFEFQNHSYLLPLEYTSQHSAQIQSLFQNLQNSYPAILAMPTEDYIRLVSAAFIQSEVDGNNGLCYAMQDPKDLNGPTPRQVYNCVKRANTAYNWCYVKTTTAYAIGSLTCTGTTLAMIGCLTLAAIIYTDAIETCVQNFNSNVKLCNSQGSF